MRKINDKIILINKYENTEKEKIKVGKYNAQKKEYRNQHLKQN